jgi:hypothetical protein
MTMNEIDAMKSVSDTFDGLTSSEAKRVLTWLVSKYADSGISVGPTNGGLEEVLLKTPAAPSKVANSGKPQLSKKVTKKNKSVLSLDKTLDLHPKGKQSGEQFAQAKAPASIKQKCTVAVYYLSEIIETTNVSASKVLAFFKGVGWPLPADMKNALSQTGTEGWLNTSDFDAIVLTAMGTNLVDHSLPAAVKKKGAN